ncbi:MAG TPA: GTPase HflX [Eubacterium sp.]|nr:GTPase HflX [Eubacterium sp.]
MLYENEEYKEKFILVAVDLGKEDVDDSLDELEELTNTCGGEVICRVIQPRESIHPGTYIGKGKIEELKELLVMYDADGIIADDELSPAQYKNLEDALDCKVMDRTLIILDIFAGRARTKEGKIQVELAQLKYRSSRLVGMRNLSRQGGSAAGVGGGVGIGSRGPGEKKLEIDRRIIRDRISQLKKEVDEIREHREVTRKNREKQGMVVGAIVGYTNAGKSTLLNTITDAEVLEEDKLFATLDPTTRVHKLADGQQLLLTDTVGFIRKLPHHLIDAFRSTLEEALYSDIIIHVVDVANPVFEKHIEAVYDTLDDLGVKDKPIITIFNKIDKLTGEVKMVDSRANHIIKTSIKQGVGLDELDLVLSHILKESKQFISTVLDYKDAGKVNIIREHGTLITEDYRDDGIFVEGYLPKHINF